MASYATVTATPIRDKQSPTVTAPSGQHTIQQLSAGAPPFRPSSTDIPISPPTPTLALLRPVSEVLRRQQTEEPLSRLYRAIATAEPIPEAELTEASPEMKLWNRCREQLSLREDGVLQITLVRNQRRVTAVACPRSLRKAIIVETHQAAHLGEWKTLQNVQLNWRWPGMQAEVRRTVKSCQAC